jgi:hypothetical protein
MTQAGNSFNNYRLSAISERETHQQLDDYATLEHYGIKGAVYNMEQMLSALCMANFETPLGS